MKLANRSDGGICYCVAIADRNIEVVDIKGALIQNGMVEDYYPE